MCARAPAVQREFEIYRCVFICIAFVRRSLLLIYYYVVRYFILISSCLPNIFAAKSPLGDVHSLIGHSNHVAIEWIILY